MNPSKPMSRKDAAQLLLKAGLRRSKPRIALLRSLSQLRTPVSHSEMVRRLESLEFDAATIFRCLNDLADAGILSRMLLGDRTWRFELRDAVRGGAASDSHHPHFVCVVCGSIICLHESDTESADDIRRAASEIGEVTEILFKGICRKCFQLCDAAAVAEPSNHAGLHSSADL